MRESFLFFLACFYALRLWFLWVKCSVDVTIRQGHRLKKDGIYSIVRHPSYAASLLSFIGFGISLNNWVSLLLIVVAILFVFINRMNIEESVLTEQFGEEYTTYKQKTKRLIPFVY